MGFSGFQYGIFRISIWDFRISKDFCKDFRVSEFSKRISRFYQGFQDFRRDFRISEGILGFQRIFVRISGFLKGFWDFNRDF